MIIMLEVLCIIYAYYTNKQSTYDCTHAYLEYKQKYYFKMYKL